MVEIVINGCYGGFGLSTLAIKEYLKLKGKEVYFYEMNLTNHTNTYYQKISDSKDGMFVYCFTKDLGEKFYDKDISNEDLDKYLFSSRNIERDDEDLVRVVKKLKDKANTMCSNLKVVEIPEDVEWQIEEYDGNEWIAEKHKTWGWQVDGNA